jgi:hypothetical protein
MKRRFLSWTTAAIAAAFLVGAAGAAGITYAATSSRTAEPQVEQTDPPGADQGPGQTGENQGDHQDPGDAQDEQDSETD